MNLKTLLFAHLAKSSEGNAQQEDGDTSLKIPNTLLPIISVPLPFFFFNSVSQVGIEKNSFIQTDQRSFSVTSNTNLCTVGPGLWELHYAHWLDPEGAVSDLTSRVRLQLVLRDGIGPTVALTHFTNSNTYPQSRSGTFKALVSSEQQLSFLLDTVIGAGTAVNVSNVLIIGNRLN